MVWCSNESEKRLCVVHVVEEFVLGFLPNLPFSVWVSLLPFPRGVILTTEGETLALLLPMKPSNPFPFFLLSLFPYLQNVLCSGLTLISGM